MSRVPDSRSRDSTSGPALAPRRELASRESPARARKSLRKRPASSAPRAALRDPAMEDLVEAQSGRVERAGRGTAQWGRYRLAADSIDALRVVGTFGTVDAGDLTGTFQSARRARGAISELERTGLLRVERFRRGNRVVDAATLTGAGKRLMERSVDPREPGNEDAQSYRGGPARSAQVLHDTAVFRAARREANAIEARGGRIRRIRTDDDLKRLAWRRIDRAKRAGATSAKAQAAAAASLDLSVHDGKLTFPDVRIEFDASAADQGMPGVGFVDVEVATPDYREPALSAKAAAGFRVYSMDADGSLRLDVPVEEPVFTR